MADRFKNIKELRKESISLTFFFDECKGRFKLVRVTSVDINPEIRITEKDIHRPGLALAGYVELFSHNRVQIFGNTEIRYLNQLSKEKRIKASEKYFNFKVPCVIVTNDNEVPVELVEIAEANGVSIFKTPYPTTRISYFINDFLDDQFSAQTPIHGSFVDVYGVGLLFTGNSGIGKSEIALDLIERGHRLVADDIVVVMKKGESILIGSSTSLSKHFMEIRGVGFIDVRSIFGVRSIRYQKRVEVIVELENWDSLKSYDRTGLNSKIISLMGVEIELINLPIFPGKNITVIAEVIALNYLCKHYGYDSAKVFQGRIQNKIKEKSNIKRGLDSENLFDRSTEYFEHDFE